jgi:3-isopropylmalate dehydrogenase
VPSLKSRTRNCPDIRSCAVKDPSCPAVRWSDFIFTDHLRKEFTATSHTVGVLKGEGIGPDVINAALRILNALEHVCHISFEVIFGGPIGNEAESRHGKSLSDEVVEFCQGVFSRGGVILAGPGGGRFVYDMRKQFDLFCKLNPLKVTSELASSGHLKPEFLQNVDILLVRDNASGVYQGAWGEAHIPGEGRKAEQSFYYTEKQVRRILKAAADISSHRRGKMAVVVKDAGVPAISRLWRDCAADIASESGVQHVMFDADYMAYKIVQDPHDFDVIVAPNMLGDILADLGGVLLGSRGLTYSGNFSGSGAAVYQTNHGSCSDLRGKDRANPVGQIFALAMLLRESFGLMREACLIENAVAEVWRRGWRTADMPNGNCIVVGTAEMGELIADTLIKLCI